VTFVDEHRDEFGVEPVCKTLQVAPSTYYDNKTRPLSARAIRDAMLMPILLALFQANYQVYGARKLWKAARRAGHDIGRDQTARLMKALGIAGVRRRRRVRTTRPDDTATRPPDPVERDFTADRPNRLWVSDLTFVSTWAGVAYVCFIIDAYSRMIVGWRAASHMRTVMVLDALEMARRRRGTRLEGLVAHSCSTRKPVARGIRIDQPLSPQGYRTERARRMLVAAAYVKLATPVAPELASDRKPGCQPRAITETTKK
jgi:putative transposase